MIRDEIIRLHNKSELSDLEMTDILGFIKTIITHITNGNKNEERLVNVMGGVILDSLQKEIGISFERAEEYLEQYGKQLL